MEWVRSTLVSVRNAFAHLQDIITGQPGEVFRLNEVDSGRLFLHYMTLSETDRQSRFHGRLLYAALLNRCNGIDWQESVFFGVRAGHRLIGVAELVPSMADAEPAMELAVSVSTGWQERGLASRLVRAAIDHVRQEHPGLPVVLFTRAGNRGMLRICRKLDGRGELLDGEYRFIF